MNIFGASWNRLNALSQKRLFIILFFAALAVRFAGVIASHHFLNPERYELVRTAMSLARTGVYGNPYAIPTGPSAHASPGYTLILAAVFKLCGTGLTGEIVKQVLACAVTAFQCALILPVATALKFDRRAALITAIFSALIPVKFATETLGDWEAPYTAIALMLVAVLTLRVYRRNFTTKNAVITGVVWGISVLFSSILLPIFLVSVLLGFIYARGRSLPQYFRFGSIECLVVVSCLAPWAIRNYRQLGAPIFTRSNLSLEMRLSNNDRASADEHINYANGIYRIYHPLQNPEEALKVRRMGEVEYNKRAEQQSLAWIRTHPKRFVELTLERARLFWFYTNSSFSRLQRSKYYLLGLFHLLAVIELVRLIRKQKKVAAVLLMILVLYPIPNYLVHLGPRQPYPVDWILNLLAIAALFRISTRYFSALAPRKLMPAAWPEGT